MSCIADFLVTIPFSFIAERYGVRVVLLCNLVPRVGMSAWAIAVGMWSYRGNYVRGLNVKQVIFNMFYRQRLSSQALFWLC